MSCTIDIIKKENHYLLKMRLEKPYLAFIFFILVNIGQIAAQTSEAERPFRIGTGLGYSYTGYREETDLPLNRYFNALNFNINCNIEKNNFYYSLNFGFLSGENNAVEVENDNFYEYHQRESIFLRAYLENALDYRLWGNSVFPGYLGGAIRGDIYYSVLQQSNYYSLTMLLSLDIHVTQKWIINEKNKFVFSASLPVFGYGFRPPYFGLLYAPLDMEKSITSLHNYRAVFGDLKYHHQINGLFSFYLGFGFEFSHITFPQPRKDALFCVNAGIAFSL
ncbi:hypothetical protein [Treponema sp. R80B11-R83G3]